MAAELLLTYFEIIADAPGGIARLRKLILQLAVQGRLVKQNLNDEPASKLLERIENERIRRVAAGDLRKPKGLALSKRDNQLFEIPFNWSWCIADNVWDFENGDRSSNYPSKDQLVASGIPFVNAGHLVNGCVSLAEMNYITRAKFESLSAGKLRKNDQIYCLRGSLGKHAIFDLETDAAIASSLVILRPVIPECIPYLSIYLNSDVAQTLLHRFDNGSAQPNLSSANLRKYEIPLPPLAEQRRIVERVDQLMALCDTLEKQQTQQSVERRRLLTALIDALTQASSADEVDTAWLRLRDNFDLVFDTPENITPLRQAVLQLAVQGRLVEQDEADEPASVLLERIQAAKREEKGSGKKARQEALFVEQDEEIVVGDVPFQPPHGWLWTKLSETGQINPRNNVSDDTEVSFVPMALVPQVYGEPITSEARKWAEVKKGFTHFAENDVVLAKITPCFQNGKAAVMRNLQNGVGAGTTELHVFRPIANTIEPNYVLIYLKSPNFVNEGIPYMTGTAGQKRVPNEYFANSAFPFPPLAEQRRIVAKVNELMAFCDTLEAKLREERAAAERLTNAFVQAILAVPRDQKPVASATSVLHQQALHKIDRGKAQVWSTSAIEPIERQTILLAWAVHESQGTKDESKLGHVKVEKIAHLVEAYTLIDLGRQPLRKMRGPADFPHLKEVIERGRLWNAFDVIPREKAEWGYQFVPLPDLEQTANRFEEAFGTQSPQIARLVRLLLPLSSRQAEAVATLYAVWNDMLQNGEQPDDHRIFASFWSWHQKKEHFKLDMLQQWLTWMREHNLVPTGAAKATRRATDSSA